MTQQNYWSSLCNCTWQNSWDYCSYLLQKDALITSFNNQGLVYSTSFLLIGCFCSFQQSFLSAEEKKIIFTNFLLMSFIGKTITTDCSHLCFRCFDSTWTVSADDDVNVTQKKFESANINFWKMIKKPLFCFAFRAVFWICYTVRQSVFRHFFFFNFLYTLQLWWIVW